MYVKTYIHFMYVHIGTGLFRLHNNTYIQHALKFEYILTYVCIHICSRKYIPCMYTQALASSASTKIHVFIIILTYVRVYFRTNIHFMHIHAGTGLFHLHNNTHTQYISIYEYIHTYTTHIYMNISYICIMNIYLRMYVSVYIWTYIYFMYAHAGTGLFRLHLQQSKDILDKVFDK